MLKETMHKWFILPLLCLLAAAPLFSLPLEFELKLVDTLSLLQLSPDIALHDSSTIFLTWTDFFITDRFVFCAKSTDYGVNIFPCGEPDPGENRKFLSRIDVDAAGDPYLVWSDFRTGDYNIRFAKSPNGGVSFNPSIEVAPSPIAAFNPEVKVSADGQLIFVAWIAYYDTVIPLDSVKVLLARSTDGGMSFLPPQHIGSPTALHQYDFSFDISGNGDTVAFAWQDHTGGPPRLLFTSSIDGGNNFNPTTNVDPNPADKGEPSLALWADTVYIAYTDNRNVSHDIRMAKTQIANNPTFIYRIIEDNGAEQDQPSIYVDRQGFAYVSYRSEEIGYRDMTHFTVVKDTVFYRDFIAVFGAGNEESAIAAFDTFNVFCAWEYNPDSVKVTAFARSLPAMPPPPPESLLANGTSPSPWDSSGDFRITFIKPYDPSDFSLILYKIGSPPTFNFDTTATLPDTFPFDSVMFMVQDTTEGIYPLFVWLMDGRGYLDYNNSASVLLRVDRTPPTPTALIEPDSNTTLNIRRPFFAWHPSTDSGGSGLLTYVMALDTTPAFDTTSWFYTTGLETTITIPDTLWDDEYFWTSIPIDSAGNWQFLAQQWNFHIRATPPPMPVSPPDSAWVGINFQLMWRRIPDPFAFTEKYFFEIATDSLFNNMVRRDSTPTAQDTIFPVNNWMFGEGYWHVRARNLYGVYTPWSPRMFFRQDTIAPPPPALISPVDGYTINNERPTFYWHPVVDSLSGLQRYILGVFNNPSLQDTVFIAMTPDTFTTPTIDLPEGDLYWIVLSRDRAGNTSMPSDTFLLTIDLTPPAVNTVIPGDGQVGVAVNTNIIATFSEPMDTVTFSDSTFIVIDNLSYRYYGVFSFNASMDQLTFDPNENFFGGRNILVTIDSDVSDIAGNMMGSDYTWQFITEFVGDSVGPAIQNLLLVPDTVYLGEDVIITATVSDTAQGNSMIVAAEYFVDSVGSDSTGMMFSAVDSFDSNIEDVIDTMATSSIPYLPSHWIFAHGLDVEGNWGTIDSVQFWIIDTLPPQISIDEPVHNQELTLGREFLIGVSANKAVSIDTCYIVDTRSNVMAIQLDRDSLLMDSTHYKASVILLGLESGTARLHVTARDANGSTSSDSVRVAVITDKSFLPEDEVYTWPNPADDEVHFRFYVNRNADITIEIFNITGRKIVTLEGFASGGAPRSEIRWQTDNVGSDLYLFRLTARSAINGEEKTVIKKFAIVK